MRLAEKNHSPRPWRALALAAIAVGYLVLFYCGSAERMQPLIMILLPDELIRQWVGGDWSRLGVFDRGPIALTAAGILFTAYCSGRLLMGAIGAVRGLSRLEIVIFALGAGMNLLSLWTLAVGLAGGLHQPLAFVLPALTVIAAWAVCLPWKRFRTRRMPAADQAKPHARPNGRVRAEAATPLGRAGWSPWFWLAVPFAVLIVLGGMLPPWEFDVREYHLQVPKEWFQQGRIDFMPHNVYGNMPLGAEMHALLAMAVTPGDDAWWQGAIVGKTIIACFAPLTALALAAAGRRWFSATAGGIAAAAYLATPWIAHVSMAGLIDGVVAFYLFTAAYAVLLWAGADAPPADADASEPQKPPGDAKRPVGLLLLGGFLAGTATACKYPSLVFVVAPLAVYVLLEGAGVWGGRSKPRTAGRLRPCVQAALLFLLAAAAGCGLWFAKNWVLAGNPTYPLLGRVFDGRQLARGDDWKRAHQVPQDAHGRSYTPAQLWQGVAQVAWRSSWISPLIVPLAAVGLFAARRRRPALVLAGLCACVLAAWWLWTHRIDRFWLPGLPLLALLAGAGAALPSGRASRYVMGGVIALCLLAGFFTVASRAVGDNRFLVALEELRRDEPNTADPTYFRVHAAHRYVNQHMPQGCRALLVGDACPFDIEPPALYATCFDESPFERLMKGRTRDERLAALRQEHIAYVFVFWHEIDRYRKTYGFSDYVTKQLVRTELVGQQKLLRKVPLFVATPSGPVAVPADAAELFEVVNVVDGR